MNKAQVLDNLEKVESLINGAWEVLNLIPFRGKDIGIGAEFDKAALNLDRAGGCIRAAKNILDKPKSVRP